MSDTPNRIEQEYVDSVNSGHRVRAESYGEQYLQHLLDQYKLFTDSSIKVTEWRNAANKYFLTVATLLVTMFGVASSFQGTVLWQRYVAGAGAILCVVWLFLIRSYKRLNSSKFTVIHEMEQCLPFAPFEAEWRIHKHKKWHRTLSGVESCVPACFALLFAALIAVTFTGSPSGAQQRLKIDRTVNNPSPVEGIRDDAP